MLGRGGGAGMGGGISSSAGSGLRAPPRWNASTCAQPRSARTMKRRCTDGRALRSRAANGTVGATPLQVVRRLAAQPAKRPSGRVARNDVRPWAAPPPSCRRLRRSCRRGGHPPLCVRRVARAAARSACACSADHVTSVACEHLCVCSRARVCAHVCVRVIVCDCVCASVRARRRLCGCVVRMDPSPMAMFSTQSPRLLRTFASAPRCSAACTRSGMPAST